MEPLAGTNAPDPLESLAQATLIPIATANFGTLQVSYDQFVYCPDGLVGLEDWKRYALIAPYGEHSLFRCLQSMDRPDLAFLLVDPGVFAPQAHYTIPANVREKIQLPADAEAHWWAITVIPKDEPDQIWINLQAPLVLNGRDKLACQPVFDERQFPLRYILHVNVLQSKAAAAAQ